MRSIYDELRMSIRQTVAMVNVTHLSNGTVSRCSVLAVLSITQALLGNGTMTINNKRRTSPWEPLKLTPPMEGDYSNVLLLHLFDDTVSATCIIQRRNGE